MLHLASLGPAHLRHPRPQPARRPQLGDRQELVGGGRVPELDLRHGLLDRQPRRGQLPQIGDAGGQRGAQLLRRRAAGLVVGQRVHGHRPQPRVLLGAAPREGGDGPEAESGSRTGLTTQRVGPQIAARRLRGDPALPVQPQQFTGGGLDAVPRVEDDRRQVEIDPVQHPIECGHGDSVLAHDQPQRRDAVLQIRQHRPAVGHRVPLPYVPAPEHIALRPAAPHERGEPGQAGVGRRAVGGVQRTAAQPVLDLDGQRVLRRRSRELPARLAQDPLDQVLPLLMGRFGELGGQREPVVRQDSHARMLGRDRR